MHKNIKTDILILGAGIGGYETFRSLSKLLKKKNINKKITIVDKNNYFTFVPMLHEAAAGSIEPNHCAVPLRELVHHTPHSFIKAEIKKIQPKSKKVVTSMGEISYEYCVVALGSTTNYFGVKGAEKFSHHVRSLKGAVDLHEEIIKKLENCSQKNLEIVVAGGGFTGVEVAGQFCDFVERDVAKLYPHIKVNISIVESGDLLLKVMPEKVRKKITNRFRKRGIKTYLRTRVKEVRADSVVLDSDKTIKSDITIWTTGFSNIADKFLAKSHTQKGRIPVTNKLTHINDPSLYAIGDIMLLLDPDSNIPYPQLAEAAHKEAQYVAKHISRTYRTKKTRPFMFKPRGVLMPIGDWYGVMIIGNFVLFGRLAWWIRRTVYLLFMPGFMRKLKIAIDWTLHGFGFRYIVDIED